MGGTLTLIRQVGLPYTVNSKAVMGCCSRFFSLVLPLLSTVNGEEDRGTLTLIRQESVR